MTPGAEGAVFVYIPPPPRGDGVYIRLDSIEAVLADADNGRRAVVVTSSGQRYISGEPPHDVLKRIQDAALKERNQ